nr:MAG: E1 protein [Betta papillomavirus 1]
MAAFLDTMAEVDNDSDGEELEALFSESPTKSDEEFIDDTSITESPPLKKLCDDMKLMCSPSKSKRNLQLDINKLEGASLSAEGIVEYPSTSEELSTQLYDICQNQTERECVIETPNLVKDDKLKKLKHAFPFFSQSVSADQLQGQWFELHKTMKSEKTMQKVWAVYCEMPWVKRGHKNERCHVGVEAVLANDADKIRGAAKGKHCYYLLQYEKGQRSIKGLKKLLESVGVYDALYGVPLCKQPKACKYLRDMTTALSEDTDVTFLTDDQLEDVVVRNTTFSMEELIAFCEDNQPATLQQLISRYTALAKMGDLNALAWRNMTTCFNSARTAFMMWQQTKQGEELDLTLSEFLEKKITEHESEGGCHNKVRKLLALHRINEINFLNTLRKWLRGDSKANVIVLQGPGNTGKSMFTHSFMTFLGGAFLSWHADNQYWKSPVLGTRYCCIDDLTEKGWINLDETERRALDGGIITVNKKFHQPTEVKFPPCIITTNCTLEHIRYDFLKNRLSWLPFQHIISTPTGPKVVITPSDWAAYFKVYKDSLDI